MRKLSFSLKETEFIRVDEAPVPEGARAYFLSTIDDCRLRVATFPVENAKGTVLLLTGWSEFIEKYLEVVTDLHKRHLNVVMMDWRGQGLSSRMLPSIPEKGHILSFGTHISDLKHVIREFLLKKFPQGPYYLMAHSMGGCVSLLLLSEGVNVFDKAFFCSPMTRLFASAPKRNFMIGLSRLTMMMGLERRAVPFIKEHSREFEGNNLTHDKTRHTMFLKLIEAAPNAALHGPTFGWVNAALEALHRLNAPNALEGITTPVKIVYAGADKTVDGSNVEPLTKPYPIIDCVKVEEAYHELFMEADHYRDQLWQEFDEFIPLRS